MDSTCFEVFADYSQFYLCDPGSTGSAEDTWTEQATHDMTARTVQ
jgi:hypothetical protein